MLSYREFRLLMYDINVCEVYILSYFHVWLKRHHKPFPLDNCSSQVEVL